MSINRRKLLQQGALGSISFASSSRFFFPKPANSYSLEYRLSRDARADAVFNTFKQAKVAQGSSRTLPSDTQSAVSNAVESIQQEFIRRNYTENQTPFAKRLGKANKPLWGRQRNEKLGPNPGFGTIQVIRNVTSSISFTGSTTAGVDRSMKVLGTDEHMDAVELDAALIPVQNRFEDWGTWEGDVDPKTGEYLSSRSVTTYDTRFGSVTRLYTVKEPGLGGFASLRFIVDGGRKVKANFNIRVDFL